MWMPIRKSLAIVAVAASAAAFGTGGAAAQSCSAMQSELARLSAGGSGAVKSQIASLERQAVANGCRSNSGWGRPRACAGLDARISELKRQGGGASNPARVRQLQRAIASNCGKPAPQRQANRPPQTQPAKPAPSRNDTAYAPDRMTTHGSVIIHGTRPDNFLGSETKQKTGFFGTLFGSRRVERLREDGTRVQSASTNPDEKTRGGPVTKAAVSGGVEGVHGIFRGGGMKTWCVRLCDGFYFPVSYSTNSGAYQRDLAICQGRCPGADVSLYSHPSYLDPEDMVSTVSGERYTKLPTAFAYRTTVSSNCSCELAAPKIKTAEASGDEAADTADVAKGPAEGDTQPADDVQVAAVATGDDTETMIDGDAAAGAAAGIAGEAATGTVAEPGTPAGSTNVTAYAATDGGETPAGDRPPVLDTVARPSPAEPGVSAPRPITEQDLNVRKVGPTYYADQIAVSAGAARARQDAR
jgi:hypothetical protein